MKTLMVAFLILTASFASADMTKNPDRTFSVGLDYSASKLNNAYPGLTLYDPAMGQNRISQLNQSITSNSLTIDVRMPITEAITLNAHGGKLEQDAFQGSSDGYTIGGGLRFYFIGN